MTNLNDRAEVGEVMSAGIALATNTNTWAVEYDDDYNKTGRSIPLRTGGSIIFETPGGKLEAYIGQYGDLEVRPLDDPDSHSYMAVVARPDSSGFPDGLRLSVDRDEPLGRLDERLDAVEKGIDETQQRLAGAQSDLADTLQMVAESNDRLAALKATS